MPRPGSAPVIVSRAPAPGESPLPEDRPEIIAGVPASCTCSWDWRPEAYAAERITTRPGCPWHSYEGSH
jgi:hypothetical protein